jgi:acyl-CoA reductase-like NAD-dependent aldehyde dehydrogenase
VVTGPGEIIGAELLKSPKVDVVNFTGETTTGKMIMQNAAPSLKRVVLELGGKNRTSFLRTLTLSRWLTLLPMEHSQTTGNHVLPAHVSSYIET